MKYIKKVFKLFAYLILGALVTLSLYTFIVTDVMKKDYVNVFGYTYFVVSTGSMSGTIEVNDIIFVKLTDRVKEDDIITYKKDNAIITHRLIRIVGDEYIAQGDANNVSDDPIKKTDIIGKVNLVISPAFILKTIAVLIILFIFMSLLNFDKIVAKYAIEDESRGDTGEDLLRNAKFTFKHPFKSLKRLLIGEKPTKSSENYIPEDIFYSRPKREEKSTGMTVNIPLKEIEAMQEKQEKEEAEEEKIEVLEFENVIDIDSNNIVTKENDFKAKEKEVLELVDNLLRVKNATLTTTKINKKWLTKYQYVFKLANIILLGDKISLEDEIDHPSFKEIYDYDLERVGLYENLRNKIYEMPIYVFLRILTYAILYNDDEFFDGVFKIMKYKIKIDKEDNFKMLKKNDSNGKKQLKLLITFMKKISLNYDNKNVFELERIEKLAKIKSYANE